MRPAHPYRALASGVGAVVIGAVIALWAYGQLVGPALGTLWDLVVLVLVLAGARRVFGKRTMDDAMEAAQELQGGDTEGGDQGVDDGDA